MQFNLICLVLSCIFASVFSAICHSDSQCPAGFHCCKGTEWCCASGYACTGTAECRLESLSAGTITGIVIGVLVVVGGVAAVVAVLVYIQYFRKKT